MNGIKSIESDPIDFPFPSLSEQGFDISGTSKKGLYVVSEDDGNEAIASDRGDTLHIAQSDGSSFAINSFDFKGHYNADSFQLIGTRSDGSQITADFNCDATWTAAMLTGWTDLVSLDATASRGAIMLDNLEFGNAATNQQVAQLINSMAAFDTTGGAEIIQTEDPNTQSNLLVASVV